MRVTRLYLENYRVYEEPLELEIPPGLVGVYGANGAGKSVLLEAILFALWGRSRTDLADVRTSGVKSDCVVECEFEHEGHLYVVRRRVKGAKAHSEAEVFADGAQVAASASDTKRYMHSILGMDDAPFRASVFAEQKQLAAFSNQGPAERKKLVLKLLGITPLDGARDMARKDAKAAHEAFDQLREVLPDLEELKVKADDLAAAAGARDAEATSAERAASSAADALAAADKTLADIDELGREFDRIKTEGVGVRKEVEGHTARLDELEREQAALTEVEARHAELAPRVALLPDLEARLPLVDAVVAARRRFAGVVIPTEPTAPDEAAIAAARAASETAAGELATIEGRLHAATARLATARDAAGRAHGLTGEADCPLCGQALGAAFEEVQRHRTEELAAAETELAELTASQKALAARAKTARADEQKLLAAVAAARDGRDAFARAMAEREAAIAAIAEAERAAGGPVDDGEPAALRTQVKTLRAEADEFSRLSGRLERRTIVVKDLETVRLLLADATGRLETLREKAKSLGFKPDKLDAARAARDKARVGADAATKSAHEARLVAVQAQTNADNAAAAIVEAEARHTALAERGEEARHLSRLAELLHGFREGVVAQVGPMLERDAGELFREFTDNEYEDFAVDPETYEIKLADAGEKYGMSRFSGSETDLANLALRIAVSEQVRLRSGGAVGLLVLDEVFGSLDENRKDLVLNALQALTGRFRQILVVTHDNDIKEQLPNAIEVVKLPNRRATARPI